MTEMKQETVNTKNINWYAKQIEEIAKVYEEAENTESTFIKETLLRGCARDLKAITKNIKNITKAIQEEIKTQINK